VKTRARAARSAILNSPTDRSILSGFYKGEADDPWQRKEGFCVLKLHGTIAICRDGLANSTILTFEDVMELDANKKLNILMKKLYEAPNLPVFFPWEIIDETLGYQDVGNDHWKANLPFDEFVGGSHTLINEIWDRARYEVQRASKVSFVGFSAHPFLERAFHKLFTGKVGNLQLCVANPDRDRFSRPGKHTPILHSSSSPIRILSLLQKICNNGLRVPAPTDMEHYSVSSFSDFIYREMEEVR
jgi:hypothetical protein